MAQYTPVTLEDRARCDNEGRWGRFIYDPVADDPIALVQGKDKQQADERAARLALCWNSHERLVQALREWVAFFDYAGLEPGHETKSRAERHRDLLAELDGAK